MTLVVCGFSIILVVQPPFLFGEVVSEDPAGRAAGFLFALACLLVATVESE
jgi:hypothetical protein